MAITLTALKSEYGAYYVANAANAQRLAKKLYYGVETDEFFTLQTTEDTVYRMGNGAQTRVLQPFQKKNSPTGDITFTPSPIQLYHMKMDVEFYPDELENSWLMFLAGSQLSRKEWPFVRWYLEEHLTPQKNEDYELNEVYAGVYAAPGVEGTAGAAGTAMNGIKYIINEAVDATAIPAANVINTGASNADPVTFLEQLESFCAQVNARYRNRAPMHLLIGNEFEMRYKQGVREKYNMNYMQLAPGERMKVADAENIGLFFSPAVGDAEKLVLTPKPNAICAVKNLGNVGKFELGQYEPRLIHATTDYWKGIGFVDFKKVFTNDRDTTAS